MVRFFLRVFIMKRKKRIGPLQRLSAAIGAGLIAGVAGTAAITISQLIEMKITGRQPSTVPADAIEKTLDIKPADEGVKPRVAQQVHWAYGTAWGITRGLLAFSGLKSWAATLTHFSAVTGTALFAMPALDIVPPVNEQQPKSVLLSVLHHAVYAAAAGFVFDAITE